LSVFLLYVLIILTVLYWTGVAEFHWLGGKKTNVPLPSSKIANVPDELQNRAVREAIFSGAVLIRAYRADNRAIQQDIDSLSDAQLTDTSKLTEETLEAEKQRANVTLTLYLSHLSQSAKVYSASECEAALTTLTQEFAVEEGLQPFVGFARQFVAQVASYQRAQVIDKQQIVRELLRK
jgi:hypothetical protein